MVGVGGRSGGCHTCRRRRVKCDETHPVCERCTKAKIDCEGYARDLKFVDEKGRAQKRVQVKRQAYLEAVHAEEAQLQAVRKTKSRSPPADEVLKGATPAMGKTLDIGVFKDTVQISFMLDTLFAGWRLFMPWVMTGYRNVEECTTTQTVKALSCVFFGRMHNNRNIFDSGMVAYCNALRLLGSDLKDPKAAYGISAVTNVLSLVIFEMMASKGGPGIMQHLGGVQRLIQARGPERHQNRPDLDVFENARLGMVHQFMEKKKRCFLEEQQWMTIPWLKHPEAKTFVSSITDRKCYLPGLLEDMEAMRTGLRASQADVSILCEKIYTELYELFCWRAAWEAAFPNCCWAVPVNDLDKPYSTAIHFSSMARAVEICHYDTVLLMLYRMGCILFGPDFDTTTIALRIPIIRTNPVLLLPTDPKSVRELGVEILRQMPYFFKDISQHGAYFQALFPLRSTFEVFTPGTIEWDYCQKTFNELADNSGFEVARKMMPNGLTGRMLQDEGMYTCMF
ncbi:Uncharacterized protein LOCC1_G004412 [Lachnellula occidentalis]|uniref:Zn(2)-C6 fungal-type domain-containing protein n=1 Tax=Lachnellula occidentalis TaxID=215460 RepID=A0A8H8S3P1_9HELO|nr:Uncharacterized protein LOCC1_G004412 [Lachnellula occidentalis]